MNAPAPTPFTAEMREELPSCLKLARLGDSKPIERWIAALLAAYDKLATPASTEATHEAGAPRNPIGSGTASSSAERRAEEGTDQSAVTPTSEEVQKEIHGLRTGWGGKGRDIMLRAADLIERLAAELAKAQEDAERYRFVRIAANWHISYTQSGATYDHIFGPRLDAAVDAARAAAIEERG